MYIPMVGSCDVVEGVVSSGATSYNVAIKGTMETRIQVNITKVAIYQVIMSDYERSLAKRQLRIGIRSIYHIFLAV